MAPHDQLEHSNYIYNVVNMFNRFKSDCLTALNSPVSSPPLRPRLVPYPRRKADLAGTEPAPSGTASNFPNDTKSRASPTAPRQTHSGWKRNRYNHDDIEYDTTRRVSCRSARCLCQHTSNDMSRASDSLPSQHPPLDTIRRPFPADAAAISS